MKEIVESIWNAPAHDVINALLGMLISFFTTSLLLFLFIRWRHRQEMNNRNKPRH